MASSAALHGERGRRWKREEKLVELSVACVCVCACVCMYVGWRELSSQHVNPAGVTGYL